MGLGTSPTKLAKMSKVTQEHFRAAEKAIRKLDWTTYGKEMRATKLGLDKLVAATKRLAGGT